MTNNGVEFMRTSLRRRRVEVHLFAVSMTSKLGLRPVFMQEPHSFMPVLGPFTNIGSI